MSRRRMMLGQSELPAGYKRCEYLESTGTQYIDTGIAPVRTDLIEFTFMVLESNSAPFGCENFTLVIDSFANRTYCRFFDTVGTPEFAIMRKNNIYNLKYTLDKVSLSENSNPIVCNPKIGTAIANGSLWLFGRSDTMIKFKCRYYACFIENIFNLIPALDHNGKPCMYDAVSKQPFYNQGSGEFLYKLA